MNASPVGFFPSGAYRTFPSISTGVYSFPVELAAKIAVHTVNRFLQDNPDSFDLVEWVLFDTHTESVYEVEVDQLYKMI